MCGQAADGTQHGAMFSADGYAVRQACAQHLPYGRYGSHYNGCGWMAAYNILHALGQTRGKDCARARDCGAHDACEEANALCACLGTRGGKGGNALAAEAHRMDAALARVTRTDASLADAVPAGAPLGDAALADTVRTDLARGLWFGGTLGTGPLRFARYLRARGLRVRMTARRKTAFCRAQACRAGAVLYWNGHGAHYVAFAPLAADGVQLAADAAPHAAQRVLRFFNARPDAEQETQTLCAFCAQACEKTPALFFTVE